MFAGPGRARPHYERLLQRFTELTEGEFDRKRDLAELTLLRQGVTFTVYNDAQGTERIFPFDLIPRIISTEEWKKIERGLEQRITALNLFLHDIYHGQSILRDGVIPKDYVWQAAHFRPEFMHFSVPRNIYIHICGSDLVRDRDGNFLVLHDIRNAGWAARIVLQHQKITVAIAHHIGTANVDVDISRHTELHEFRTEVRGLPDVIFRNHAIAQNGL